MICMRESGTLESFSSSEAKHYIEEIRVYTIDGYMKNIYMLNATAILLQRR